MNDSIPIYYKEPVFFSKEFWHPEIHITRIGSEGTPVAFRASSDDVVVVLVLLAVILMVVSFMRIKPFLSFQYKHLTYTQRGRIRGQANILREHMFQQVMLLAGSMAVAVMVYLSPLCPQMPPLVAQEWVLLGAALLMVAYFLLKRVLYLWVNNTFLGSNNIQQWNRFYLFLTSVEMMALLPVLVVDVFIDFYGWFTLIYIVFLVICAKFLTLYKQTQLFFRQNEGFLQNILYFCALEVVPLLLIVSSLELINLGTVVKY